MENHEKGDLINFEKSLWKPDVIVLGPGGAKGYLELGALLKFEEVDYFENVKYWTGCSIGSAAALMMRCSWCLDRVCPVMTSVPR